MDLAVSFGAAFGVFASSSGGGNPCLYTSGGGPYGFCTILLLSLISLLLFSLLLPPHPPYSILGSSSLASGVATVVGGFAASSAKRLHEELLKIEALPDHENAGLRHAASQPTVRIGKAVRRALRDELHEHATNPEVFLRTAAVLCVSVGLRIAFAVSASFE